MRIRFDSGGVVSAAGRIRSAAQDARRMADHAGVLQRGVADPALDDALTVLGDVCGDALEVVALDLDLLAVSTRAGAAVYTAVEGGLARSSGGAPAGDRSAAG